MFPFKQIASLLESLLFLLKTFGMILQDLDEFFVLLNPVRTLIVLSFQVIVASLGVDQFYLDVFQPRSEFSVGFRIGANQMVA